MITGEGLPNKDSYVHMQWGWGGCTLNLLSESVWCRSGIIGQGRQGDPMEAYSVLTACAAHTNWTPLLGLTVMKLLLS